ncbi:sel1 repeat family protein [Beggiatoa alba]|nr:sel1 repeat family protein [Beggiatoa alba]
MNVSRSLLLKITTLLMLYSISLYPGNAASTPLQDGFDAYLAGRYEQALRLWLPLAQNDEPSEDNTDAMFNIGLLYMHGKGVKQDSKMAKQWFKRAAFYGSADAAYNLGTLYMSRKFGFPSKKDALYWWKQAAEQGHTDSQYNLGVLLAFGRASKIDTKGALSWWHKAASKGHKQSAQALAEAYQKGLFGLKKDNELAQYWRKLSQ